MIAALLWTRLGFLMILGVLVIFYVWTTYRTSEDK
jgi:uncharacterized membrane protein YqjE